MGNLVKTRTTLIVCPASLMGQWENEIKNKVVFRFVIFFFQCLQCVFKAFNVFSRPIFVCQTTSPLPLQVLYVWKSTKIFLMAFSTVLKTCHQKIYVNYFKLWSNHASMKWILVFYLILKFSIVLWFLYKHDLRISTASFERLKRNFQNLTLQDWKTTISY